MLQCPDCHETFKNSRSLYNHKSREKKKKRNGLPTCAIRKQYIEENQIVRETIENTDKREIFQAIHERSETASTNVLLEDLKKQLGNQNKKMDCLIQQNEEQNIKISELKDIMIDVQNNPRLLVLCNNLYSLKELNLAAPEFKPVLEILDKELPEYPNLGNIKTGKIHAKAINKLNHIQPTALKNGEDIYFKNDNILAKDTDNTTTKAFIDAIGKLGYEYAQKALDDLRSQRESDQMFKKESLSNATKDAIPQLNDIV